MITTTTVTSFETSRGKVGIVVVIVLALTTVSSVSGVEVGRLNIELSVVSDDAGGTFTVVAMFLPQKVTSARCTHAVRARGEDEL